MKFTTTRPVAGDEFVGRGKELEEMSRLWSGGNPVIALVGLPHIGKSSVAQRFIANEPRFADKEANPVFEIDFSTWPAKSGYEMMRTAMIMPVYDHLCRVRPEAAEGEMKRVVDAIDALGDLSGVGGREIGALCNLAPEFFRLLAQEGIVPTYVFDRFERAWLIVATELFSNFRKLIQADYIRQLLLTTRPVASTVAEADKVNVGEVSSYPSCVKTVYVGMFSRDDYKDYCSRALPAAGVGAAQIGSASAQMERLCGRFPMLLNAVCREMAAQRAAGTDVYAILDNVNPKPFYADIIKGLDKLIFRRTDTPDVNGHSRLTNALFSLAFLGWCDDRRDGMTDLLSGFGLIAPQADGRLTRWKMFSQDFSDWFRENMLAPDGEMIHLAEQSLRELCTDFLMDKAEEELGDADRWEEYLEHYYLSQTLDRPNSVYKGRNEAERAKRLQTMVQKYRSNRHEFPNSNMLEFAVLSDYRWLFIDCDANWDSYFSGILMCDACLNVFGDRNGMRDKLIELENYRNNADAHATPSKVEALACDRDSVMTTCQALYTQLIYD